MKFFTTVLLVLSAFIQLSQAQPNDIKLLELALSSESTPKSKKLDTLETVANKYVNYLAFKNQLDSSPSNLSTLSKKKIELVFLGITDSFPKLIAKSESLLEHPRCKLKDSIFTYYVTARYLNFGNYFNYALGNYLTLLDLYEKNALLDQKQHLLHDIGLVYHQQKQHNRAIKFYKRALAIDEPTEDFLFPYQISNNLALAYDATGQYDSALTYFQKVETFLITQLPDSLKGEREQFFLGLVRGNQGSVFAKLGDYDKAISLLEEDLVTSIKTDHKLSACNARISLAQIYLTHLDQLNKSKSYLDKAYSCAQKHHLAKQRNNCLKLFALYYKKAGLFRESSSHYEKFIKLNDSLNKQLLKQTSADFKLELALMDQKNEVEMLKLESKTHKAELKSRKLQLYFTLGLSILLILILTILLINYRNKTSLNQSLLEKNFEIQKRGVQLESALHEKNLMLKEMHHRVKNNLQLVQSLLRLQAAEVKDPIVSLAFSESINRLSSMSLIHQNLYQQEKFKFIEFKSYLQSLVDHLQDSFHNSHENVTVKVDAEELDISIDNAIPSGLILNELISNAFQHAFKNTKEGKIKVSISKTKNLVSFQVHDNGDGLSNDFSLENDSFGTTLIKMLVQQIQGKIEFANKTGAFFKVTFEDKVD